jgi:hypothetical protein
MCQRHVALCELIENHTFHTRDRETNNQQLDQIKAELIYMIKFKIFTYKLLNNIF